VYQFFDGEGKILYVGKAKPAHRVGSYFAKEHPDGKTRLLVRKIADLRTIVVDTSYEALLLENSLIKEYQPRYNILLKRRQELPVDPHPQRTLSRAWKACATPRRTAREYFGPFASAAPCAPR
jgi:excinuclease ABC subunit C